MRRNKYNVNRHHAQEDLLPGNPVDWWRSPAKQHRESAAIRQLEVSKLEKSPGVDVPDPHPFNETGVQTGDVWYFSGTEWVPSTITEILTAGITADYTVTNHTDDRTLDETADTLVQVANCLGTLINDLVARGIIE